MSALLLALAQLLWGWVLVSALFLGYMVVRAHCLEARDRHEAQRHPQIPEPRS